MRYIIVALCITSLAGCGVESMSTATTAAALKKQELEQGKKSMDQMQQKISQAMQQTEQRNQKMTEAAGN